MTIRTYRSTDTGSPGAINNVAGQMLGVLDVLVNGYALGTVSSITRSGSTATLTFSAAHNLLSKGNRITIAGCDQAEYNGEFLVAVPDTTTVTFTVTGTPATPATGTITASKAGSGWTKPYTGTNLAAYKQGTGSNGFYLRVDDTGTTSARCVGYETMSDVNTGTGDFPTAAQVSGGLYLSKSNGSTTRDWILIASETEFKLWVNYTGTTTSAPLHFYGDINSYVTADAFATLLSANTATAATTGNGLQAIATSLSSTNSGSYMTRTAAQTGTSITIGKSTNYTLSDNAAFAGANGMPFPSLRGSLEISQLYVNESALKLCRGVAPGVLAPLHNQPLTHLDTFVGTGDYAGQVFLVLSCYNSGQIFIRVE